MFCESFQWGGRREKRCLQSLQDEGVLLQSMEAAALQGGVLVAKQLREAVENKGGHGVSDNYLWAMLRRQGGRKKAPRPEHTKAAEVKEKREAFKKKPRNCLPHQEKGQGL